ncbi:MAG: transcriptional regulator [Burkholderiaceae bacterium]
MKTRTVDYKFNVVFNAPMCDTPPTEAPSAEAALQKAIDVFKTDKAFASAMQISPQTLSNWKTRGVPVPECPRVERVTGLRGICERLQPSIDWAVLRAQVDPSETVAVGV